MLKRQGDKASIIEGGEIHSNEDKSAHLSKSIEGLVLDCTHSASNIIGFRNLNAAFLNLTSKGYWCGTRVTDNIQLSDKYFGLIMLMISHQMLTLPCS